MAIIKYIPKKVQIIDRRSEDGGYYVAECENESCGREFYPKRNNAKYCSYTCNQMVWRSRQGGKVKEEEKAEEPPKTIAKKIRQEEGKIVYGSKNVMKWMGEHTNTWGQRRDIKHVITHLEINEQWEYEELIIGRVSEMRYKVLVSK